MRAFGHIATGVSFAIVTGCTLVNLAVHEMPINLPFENPFQIFIEPGFLNTFFGGIGTALFFGLYILGLVLPDCDNEDSYISRIVHISFDHRTWTHSVWAVLLLLLLGILYHPVLGLALGVFVHIFVDSFSRAGVCWLYPFTKYKTEIKYKSVPDKYITGLEHVYCGDPREPLDPDREVFGWHQELEFKQWKEHKYKLYSSDVPSEEFVLSLVCFLVAVGYAILTNYSITRGA